MAKGDDLDCILGLARRQAACLE